jgi:hypothetical protein
MFPRAERSFLSLITHYYNILILDGVLQLHVQKQLGENDRETSVSILYRLLSNLTSTIQDCEPRAR